MSALLQTLERIGRWGIQRRGAKSLWWQTEVGRIHGFHIQGKGSLPPVVMLHGLGSSSLAFGPLLQLLQPHVQELYAIDAPGHGLSEMPHTDVSPAALFEGVASCLDQLPCRPFVLIGNSLGGGMTLRYALSGRQKLRALVALSPAGAPTSPQERPQFLSRFEIHKRADASAFVDQLFYRVPSWYKPLIVSLIHSNFQRPILRAFLESVKDPAFDEEYLFKPEELSSLELPMLLVWGQADGIMPSSHLPYFQTHLPEHVEVLSPHRAGHSPQVEMPQEMAEAITRFLREKLA